MHLTIVGCGYVGMALARHLQERRPKLRLTLTTTQNDRRAELDPLADQVVVCEAQSQLGLYEALNGCDIAVFSFGPAGNHQVDEAGYRHIFIDSFACLDKLLPELATLKQLIYTSSCSVYGDARGSWVDEATPPNPRDDLGAVILESERLLQSMASSSRRVCLLRLGALHGLSRDLKRRFRSLAGQKWNSDGQEYTNWIHVDDVAGVLTAAIDGNWSGVVNVVDNTPISMSELLDSTLQQQGLEPIQWSKEVRGSICNRRICNARLHKLGYQLIHPSTAPTIGSVNVCGDPKRLRP
ncbi:oxidoreductase [cyanobiont of Ornithocercus magnificus]|nr:oxidoreductase [cyanobiont of Ornithocercus magnificus]